LKSKKSDTNQFYYIVVNNKLLLHVIFWLTFTIFYSFVYGPSYESFTLKLFHTLLLLPVAIVASYFTILVVIDKLLLKHKYTLFILTLFFSAVFFTFLQVCVYYFFILPNLYPEADVSLLIHFDSFLIELLRLYAIVTLATVLKLLRHWNRMKSSNIQLIEKNHRAELKIKDIERQKIEAELSALKSQLNPHFLFNVLNNIYSHSLLKSDITPSIVLKLSNLMSYILYDCKAKLVSLQKEVEFIKNYIELEKIRLEKDIEITYNINNVNQALIPPLLFIPLIENAFKHGIGSHPDDMYISLTMEIHKDNFRFKLENPKGAEVKTNKKDKKGGIGIENVRKRLNLLYPMSHELTVSNNADNFNVEIIINDLKQNKL